MSKIFQEIEINGVRSVLIRDREKIEIIPLSDRKLLSESGYIANTDPGKDSLVFQDGTLNASITRVDPVSPVSPIAYQPNSLNGALTPQIVVIRDETLKQAKPDMLPVYILGVLCFGLFFLVFVWLTKPQQPYTTTIRTCIPSGFLWLNQTCREETQRGFK